jgi:hypothetical protein
LAYYIEAKFVQAAPMKKGEFYSKTAHPFETRRGDPNSDGFILTYPDGHMEWIPKAAFESSHLPVEQTAYIEVGAPSVTEDMVNSFIKEYHVHTLGDRTTVVIATLVNGFELVESSSCVSAENYNVDLGTDICKSKIKDKVWLLLGFLLKSAVSGFNGSVYHK